MIFLADARNVCVIEGLGQDLGNVFGLFLANRKIRDQELHCSESKIVLAEMGKLDR